MYFAGNCLSSTEPGTRAAIYHTGEGITALWDFSGPAVPVGSSSARMAAGIYRPLARPILRAELMAEPLLRQRFERMVSRGALKPDQALAIDRLAERGGLPVFVRFTPPPWATQPQQGLDWTMAPDSDWGREHPIQMSIAQTRRLWRQLGFTEEARTEIWSADRRYRYDLLSIQDRIVGEVKYTSSTADLQQLRDYIDHLAVEFGGSWHGALIGGDVGPAIAHALTSEELYDLSAWRLERSVDEATLHFVGRSRPPLQK